MELIGILKTEPKYLLNTFYVPGTSLQDEDTLVLLQNVHSSERLQIEDKWKSKQENITSVLQSIKIGHPHRENWEFY